MFIWGVVTGAAIMFGGVLLGAVLVQMNGSNKPTKPVETKLSPLGETMRFSSRKDS